MGFWLDEFLCKIMESDFRDNFSDVDGDSAAVVDFSEDKKPMMFDFGAYISCRFLQ